MKTRFIYFLLLFTSSICYSQLQFVDAEIEVIQVDTIGYYSDITFFEGGKFIGLSGSNSTYPNCVAYSSDYGNTWKRVDYIENPDVPDEYTKYYSDYKTIEFNNQNELIIFSDFNKFFIYKLDPLERDEYLLQNQKSIEEGRFVDFIKSVKIGDDYYIYTRSESTRQYDDESTITVLNSITHERKYIKFDMFQLAQLSDARGEDRYQNPNYNDEYLTQDKCFFATISNLIDIGEEFPIWVKSLIRIVDFENPNWEVFPLLFTDSISKKFIYFVDCQNGFLSTYKTYKEEYPRLYQTSDGGETWEKIYEDNNLKYVLRNFKRANSTTLFATSNESSIYRSTDNGRSWSRIESEYNGRTTDYEIIDENTLLLAYNKNSLVKLTIGEITDIIETGETNDLKFGLPYPQPADTEVRIDYDYSRIIDLSLTAISIIDLMGREIENPIIRLENNSIIWDCSSVQSGIYMINIMQGVELISKKIIVR